MSETRLRREYLDWMRGLAVLVMIEAHVLDSWTRLDARDTWPFGWAMILGGFGAPLFLFLAGLSVSLSASARLRRSGDVRASAMFVIRRGLWVFGLAFLFRLQAMVVGFGPLTSLLKIDILNIMGPGIVAAAALWGAGRTSRSRAILFGATALAIGLLAPIVRQTTMLDGLPDPLEGYLRPMPGRSNFCLFPWVGFVFAGGLVGVLIDAVRTSGAETALNVRLFACGAALAVAAYASSWLPSPYARSEFWGASPSFFLIRTGIMLALVALAYAWGARPQLGVDAGQGERGDQAAPWSPLQQLGRSSLFVYWIHVEMVYGLISLPIHKGLSHSAAWAAFGTFTLFMLACVVAKDRIMARRSGRPSAPPAPVYAVQ
jgi:uncharacterized membrane protein